MAARAITRDATVGSLGVRKSTVSASNKVFFALIYASVTAVKTASLK